MSFVATSKDLVIVILSEWSQTENEEQCMISLVCGTLKKKKSLKNLFTKQKQTQMLYDYFISYDLI